MSKKKRKAGRPHGAKTAKREIVHVHPVACPKCGSTDRTPHRLAFVREMPGVLRDGQRYSRILYRDCQCLHCKTPRREAHFELETPGL